MIYYDIEHQSGEFYTIEYRRKWWHRWRPVTTWMIWGTERPKLVKVPRSMKYMEALEFCERTTEEALFADMRDNKARVEIRYAEAVRVATENREALKKKGIVIR